MLRWQDFAQAGVHTVDVVAVLISHASNLGCFDLHDSFTGDSSGLSL